MTKPTAYQRYLSYRRLNPDKLIIVASGDFYECFDSDAIWAGENLSLTVASRAKKGEPRQPMVGFPHYQLHGYQEKAKAMGREVVVVE